MYIYIRALASIGPSIVANTFELLCTNLDGNYQPILEYMEDNYSRRMRGHTRRQAPYTIDFWSMVEYVKKTIYIARTMTQKASIEN